jgi:hypothetical protein
MNSARYEELLGRLLEGELSEPEAEEMAGGLDERETLREDLWRHLALWELWSQQQAPERSPDAFVRAWKMRLRAETEDADLFPGAVRAQLEARQPRPGIVGFLRQLLAACRPARMAWAVSLTAAGLALTLWFAAPRSAHAVTTFKGEAVCPACVLHESQEHAPALRVIAGSDTNVWYLDRNPAVAGLQDYFCGGPAPITVVGKTRMAGGRRLLRAITVALPKANKAPEKTTNAVRIIFPI